MDFYGDNQLFMKKNVLCVWLNISILMNGDNVSTYANELLSMIHNYLVLLGY